MQLASNLTVYLMLDTALWTTPVGCNIPPNIVRLSSPELSLLSPGLTEISTDPDDNVITDLNSGNVPGKVIENICNIEPGQ